MGSPNQLPAVCQSLSCEGQSDALLTENLDFNLKNWNIRLHTDVRMGGGPGVSEGGRLDV
jgi:lipopolysaccharide export system protein LptC